MRTSFIVGALLLFLSGCAPVQNAYRERYGIAITHGAQGWYAIRYDSTSGTAWLVEENALLELQEPAPLPRGRYKVFMAPREDGFGAVRVEESSGRTWILLEHQWRELTPRKASSTR